MKKKYYSHVLMFLGVTACSTLIAPVYGAEEDVFLGQMRSPSEQTLGHGRTALWTLPLVAAQYQPSKPSPAMQKALQAQNEGRFLDAMIALDEARGQAADVQAEMDLLRASFLLQGSQFREAQILLTPLSADARHAGDAYALTAMSYLQQGKMREALEAAQRSHEAGKGVLPHLALSYALQGNGKLMEAREAVHSFNASTPQEVTLAREAELDLTLGQVSTARALVQQSQATNAAHSYVVAVSGLAYLIDEQPARAKAAFESTLRRDPQDPKALLGLGLAEIKLGNLQEGMKKLQAANESEPGNALILTYLGRAQQQAGQEAAARESWRAARQADPKDPTPWLYQAQAELQANRPQDAQESLREAQARTSYRNVYRGENLLKEDEQLLRANLAEVQRRMGMDSLAFYTLADASGEAGSAMLRNQADLLQGVRFGESARRSLLLQSLFNETPGNLPSELDIYGDGAGQTGANTPQHGAVSGLNAQQLSYNNYDALFNQRTSLVADAVSGSKNTNGEQVRAGIGSDTLGFSIAQRRYKSDGFVPFENLDNTIAQAVMQWQPVKETQAFVSHQTFDSQHGETLFPGDPGNAATRLALADNSQVTRLGLRHDFASGGELRALWSHQQTGKGQIYIDFLTGASLGTQTASSETHGAELQYLIYGTNHALQWGVQHTYAQVVFPGLSDNTRIAEQGYAAWQQVLGPHWQLEAQLGWGKIENQDNTGGGNGTYLKRWLPKLGVVYAPDATAHVRLAAWHGMGFGEAGDATLAPATLVGVVLVQPGDNSPNGKLLHAAVLSADKQLGAHWLLEGQTQQRRIDNAIPPLVGQTLIRWQFDESRVALRWQPENQPWLVSLAYDHEHYLAPTLAQYIASDSIQEQRLCAQQLEVRWLAGEHWTANLAWSNNRVDGILETTWFSTLLPYQDNFDQVDASLNWQFAKVGSLDLGVRNAADKRFQYTNLDALLPRFSNGRLAYAKLKLNW